MKVPFVFMSVLLLTGCEYLEVFLSIPSPSTFNGVVSGIGNYRQLRHDVRLEPGDCGGRELNAALMVTDRFVDDVAEFDSERLFMLSSEIDDLRLKYMATEWATNSCIYKLPVISQMRVLELQSLAKSSIAALEGPFQDYDDRSNRILSAANAIAEIAEEFSKQ